MRVSLAFATSDDDRFFVLVETSSNEIFGVLCQVTLVPYEDEDAFLKLAVEADLKQEDTTRLVTAVILSVANPSGLLKWFEFELTDDQQATLGFDELQNNRLSSRPLKAASSVPQKGFNEGNIADFYGLMTQAPTAFVLLSGPELRFTFANPAYSQLIHRPPQEELLGKPVREALSDLRGSRIFDVMDRVMRTGIPYVGTEVRETRVHPETGEETERYYDFIYHPMREASGKVSGLMVQVADVTERVLTREVNESREAQLYAQWAELEAIYRTAPVGMALFDGQDLRVLRINDKHAEVLKIATDQIRCKTALQLSSHLPEFGRLLTQAAKGKSFRNIVIREDPQEGVEIRRSWLINIAPALGASGQIAAISSVILEIPGQAWPGGALEDSDNLITEVLESTTDGVFVVDREWNIIYLNSRARATLPGGETLLGHNHWEVFPASKDLPLWAEYHRTMIDRVPTSCTISYPPNGRWYDIQAYPAKLGISIFFKDVTEIKLEEQALRDSEERFRVIVDLNPQISFTMSADGNLLDFGSRFEELTGLTSEDAAGRGFLKAVHPEDLERVIQWLDDTIKGGPALDLEWRARRKDGQYLWLRSRITPSIGRDGKVARFYGSSEDIDELKKLKDRLQAAESELEFLRMETGRLVGN